jgi:hypothetical protein
VNVATSGDVALGVSGAADNAGVTGNAGATEGGGTDCPVGATVRKVVLDPMAMAMANVTNDRPPNIHSSRLRFLSISSDYPPK